MANRVKYSDGHPLDEVQYLECKLILKPDRFTAAKVFRESYDVQAAEEEPINESNDVNTKFTRSLHTSSA
jgi:hypothetical protein